MILFYTNYVTEEEYITALRSSLNNAKIYLRREVQDIYINCYMKDMLSAWQANHDIQFVLHTFSCIVYKYDYMTKSQKAMSDLLATACNEAREGNMTLKESV